MRRSMLMFLLAALAAAASPAAPAGTDPPSPLRRYALVAGSNDGGASRVRLRYAATDAQAMARVLRDLGGVRDEDLVLLVDPDLPTFTAALSRLRETVQAAGPAGERREIVFYYSGHSDERGLILGSDIYLYDDLRAVLALTRADVRVAILDSCSSGALTRAKGGSRRPAFLFDASQDMSGHAFITSSSAAEAAQESDRIGASFFTHYFVSGLRGAADATGDGLVTLNEAYAYAFQETLASTENTQYGPQHPAYDISLTGSGDLVLTDLRAASAVLVIAEEMGGRLYVRDARGALVVELAKTAGQRVELGLEPGIYALVLDDRGARSAGEVSVSTGGRVLVGAANLRPVSGERTTSRGDGEPPVDPTLAPPEGVEPDEPLVYESFRLSFLPAIAEWVFGSRVERAVSINLLIGTSARVTGVEFGSLLNFVTLDVDGLQGAGVGNIVLGELHGLQMAGVVNWAGSGAKGAAQVAGVVNLMPGAMNGGQIAGVANWAGQVFGPQISVVNVADTVRGVQIGVVNVARLVQGTQIGVLNLARKVDGVSIGLLTLEEQGRHALEVWGDPGGGLRAAFKLGSRSLATVVAAGWEPGTDPVRWSYGIGLGARFDLGTPFFLDVDALVGSQHAGTLDWATVGWGNLLPTLHAVAGWKVLGPVAVSAGIDVDVYVPGMSRNPDGSAVDAARVVPRVAIGLQL
jgi:hypothetical protein